MKNFSLILSIVAIVAAVAFGGLYFSSKGKLAEAQSELMTARQAVATTQAELASANEKIGQLESRLNNERQALANSKRNLESVRSEMHTARQEVRRSQQQLNEANSKISELESTARRLRSDLVKTEQSLARDDGSSEASALKERIAELEAQNSERQNDLKDSSYRVATSEPTKADSTDGRLNRTFSPESNAPAGSASLHQTTTIRSVSLKNGLIVLHANPSLGLRSGQTITLIQGLKAVGKVSVSRVTDSFAVANILPGVEAGELVPGSTVSLLR
jgi:peptidoglycan hydrolase CwlO-like protein